MAKPKHRNRTGNNARGQARNAPSAAASGWLATSKTRVLGPVAAPALALFSAVGLVFSFKLLESELTVLKNSDAPLACDVNPLIGCSSSLLAPQSHLIFGLPNSSLGIFLFSMLLALACVLVLGGSLPRLIWAGMAVGMLAGLGYVAYFLHQSVTVFHTLCPYCMVIWACIFGASPLVWSGALRADLLGSRRRRIGDSLSRYAWAVTTTLALVAVLIIVVGLRDKVALVF